MSKRRRFDKDAKCRKKEKCEARINIRCPHSAKAKFEKDAQTKGMTLSNYVRKLLLDQLDASNAIVAHRRRNYLQQANQQLLGEIFRAVSESPDAPVKDEILFQLMAIYASTEEL